jgi:hypothetical protein
LTILEKQVKHWVQISAFLGLVAGIGLGCPGVSLSQTPAPATAVRDGQHDFDFNIGVWNTHIKRILDPFANAPQSYELSGTVTVSKIWDGKGQLEEIEADGPKGHWEGLTLFLYNPAAHQWSQIFTNSKLAMMGTPLIGEFKEGRGELYATDTFNGRSVLIRGVWSDITPNAHRFTESISADGGVTWFPTFIGELTRRAP